MCGGSRNRRCLASRETDPVERQADGEVDRREDHERAAPAIGIVQVMADHPEDGRGVGAVEREIRDRLAAARRRDLHQGGERRVVETAAHADADHRPHRQIAERIAHLREREEPRRYDDRADRHHRAGADPIDEPADPRRDEAHDEERDAEAEKDRGHGPSGLRDDRLRQDAEAVVARAPGRDLREPKRIDGDGHGVRPPSRPRAVGRFAFLPALWLPRLDSPGNDMTSIRHRCRGRRRRDEVAACANYPMPFTLP